MPKYLGLRVFLKQWQSPFVILFVLAGLATWYIGDVFDAWVIGAAVVFNLGLGFFQEYKSERTLESLAKLVRSKALVKVGNEWKEIEADKIKVGDVLRLLIGGHVSADGVLVVEDGMFVNESVLTGESVGVEKKVYGGDASILRTMDEVPVENCVYSGTVVEKGIGEMRVLAVGKNTRMGKIAKLTTGYLDQKTPLQIKVGRLSNQISVMVVALCLLIVVLGVFRGRGLVELLPIAIAVAVSAIPEGLIVAQTLILVLAMRKILARKAVVRGLMSAETLGSVEVICLDKTGTITDGKMQAVGVVTSEKGELLKNWGSDEQTQAYLIGLGAVLCNDDRDPLEFAMRDWAVSAKLNIGAGYERQDGLPFDHKYRYIVTRHKKDREIVEYISGAPEVVIEHCKLRREVSHKWKVVMERLGGKGYRLVAFGYKKMTAKTAGQKIVREKCEGYEYLGVIAFVDPPRVGVEETLKKARMAGLEVKIITGDYKETAWAAMRGVGLVNHAKPEDFEVVTGAELVEMTKVDRKDRVATAKLFARTSPEQKLEIVESLRADGLVVAMTGDGVNDAPALKAADVGVVVSKASDVAREAGDLVLLDDDFSTILAAVEAGRDAWVKLKRVVLFLMADAFSTLILIVGGLLLGWPMPISASAILFTNLVSDGLPYLGLVFDDLSKGLMTKKPLGRSEQIVSAKSAWLIILLSLVIGGLGLGVFGFVGVYLGSLAKARAMVFAIVLIAPLLFGLLVKNIGARGRGLFENRYLTASLMVGLVGVLVLTNLFGESFGMTALNLFDWMLLAWLLGMISFVMVVVSLLMV